ncbi:MAG: CusA/CzcA family heavy metal efflux RND transporter [Sandaracinus sp.]
MLESITDLAARRRGVFLVLGLALLASGASALPRLPIDALPDVTNVQVVVLTEAPGLSAEEMERFVTFPIEMSMTGTPRLDELRSVSRAGLSAVTLVFDDGTDLWFARQLVSERLRDAESSIPERFGRPQLAPVTTGLGEIYRFVLRSDTRSPMELRDFLQWDLSPRLRSVPGVIEVNAMGGASKEFQVVLDPDLMRAHDIALPDVLDALERGNASVGGGWIERGPEQLTIRGEGLLRTTDEIGSVVVAADADGTPTLVRHLGEVRVGAALPYGVVTQDGEGEAVTGVVLMLIGQNSRDVVHAVHAEMERIEADLPEDVRIEVVYDRTSFIDRTLETVAHNLAEGLVLVAIVVLVFLRSWRAALLVTLGIPFAMIVAVWGMIALGVDGSLMSLGAIDFGLLVDGPIVMVEAVIARLAIEEASRRRPAATVAAAIRSVVRPVVFSVLIVLLVYLPLLALEGQEGKMFRPMAVTMALALAGSVIFSLFVFPAGAALLLRPGGHHEGGVLAWLARRYERALALVLSHRVPVLALACALLALAFFVAGSLGANFVPRIEEGDLVVNVRRIPSIGLGEARRLDLETERVLRRFPEVMRQLALTGRAEVATDPVGVDTTEMLVRLRPHEEWTTAHDLDALAEAMKQAIESEVPSTFVSISQPIEDRTNELISGSRADVAVLLFGDDLERMTGIARRIGEVLREVPGTGDVRVERALGLPMLTVRPDRQGLARYGMPSETLLAAVEASRQGRAVGHVFEGERRYDLRVMLPPEEATLEGMRRLPVGAADGTLIPLGAVATVVEEDGPAQISREGLHRRLRVEVNIRGRDLVSYVREARARVEEEVPLPDDGYWLVWGGQFENFERASARLAIVVPLALGIIFAMLFGAFGEVRYAVAVFSGVPFSLVGGVLGLAVRGMEFSLPAAVGFIALCGIAVLNGVVMASEVRRRHEEGAGADDAVSSGAVAVLRAMLLTATVAAIGFLPMALSTSAGSEVQRPLATVVIGGMVSSTLLGLFVLPILLRMAVPSTRDASADDDGI